MVGMHAVVANNQVTAEGSDKMFAVGHACVHMLPASECAGVNLVESK